MSAAPSHAQRPQVAQRARELFRERLGSIHRDTDRVFALLMALQFLAGLALATLVPAPSEARPHVNLYLALFLGGALSSIPILLALARPGERLTRHVVAVSQMLWSALLIHLTGGSIESQFHVFGSLALLAFYRDLSVLATATAVVVAGYLLRGMYLPLSVYRVLAASP